MYYDKFFEWRDVENFQSPRHTIQKTCPTNSSAQIASFEQTCYNSRSSNDRVSYRDANKIHTLSE
jgi:hypothetical protein